MGAEDGVRWLTFLSAAVLFSSALRQAWWQRTQAHRDEEQIPALPAVAASAPGTAVPLTDEEAENVRKFIQVQRENALRPFFDKFAFRLFLLGFVISVISSTLDLLAHGPLREFLEVPR